MSGIAGFANFPQIFQIGSMKPFPTAIDSVDEFKRVFDEVEYILTGRRRGTVLDRPDGRWSGNVQCALEIG